MVRFFFNTYLQKCSLAVHMVQLSRCFIVVVFKFCAFYSCIYIFEDKYCHRIPFSKKKKKK